MGARSKPSRIAEIQREKREQREQDERDLAEGRRSVAEIKRKNEAFAALKVRLILNKSSLV
ncbi:MAG: hypothetical protein JST92_25135 [Deltaproteobacteria bacterium]|nr:hypothetical protein [Deltaproteobacteria bacterium]